MRYQNLDLNLLVALDHLLRHRSVSVAAAEMRMTQSAMSNALARLRDYFGDELLVKVGRRLEPTPRAEALKEPVREVLTRVDWTIASRPAFDPAKSDRAFNLLVSDYTLATLAPEMLKLSSGSRVRFNFLHQVAGPERLLERGDLDLLVIPADFASRRHPFEQILEERFCAIAWSEGPHAATKLTRKAFVEAGHVAMVTPDGAESLESVFFRKLGVARNIEIATHSFTTIPALVSGSHRLATLHRRLADQARRAFPIVLIDLPFRMPAMRQVMQWHKHRAQDAALAWLRSLIRNAATSLQN